MKFQTVEAFEKHLKEAFPEHPSNIYLVASPHDFERKKWIEEIARFFLKKGECDVKAANDIQEVLIHLNTASLFGGIPVATLDRVEEHDLSKLSTYIAKPSPFSYLILGASSLKLLSDFYDQGKKEMVILDLSQEKSWQREKRIKKQFAAQVAREGKILSAANLDFLFRELPLEMGILEQELNKLISYVGDKKEISLEDIRAISCTGKAKEGWQIADEIVWNNKMVTDDLDDSMLFGLIGQIRYYLEKGFVIASLVEKGSSLQEIAEQNPDISSSLLEKYGAKPKKSSFFKKGLILLFQLELSAKNSAAEPQTLFTLFCGKLLT